MSGKTFRSVDDMLISQGLNDLADQVRAMQGAAIVQHALWVDDTPLTLDTLRAELGEPEQSFDGNSYWPGVSYESGGILVGAEVRTLGQLRRLLSVIRETETGSGDAK